MIVRITSKYGEVSQIHPTGHKGVDIGLNEGTPLKSISNGVIEQVYDGSSNIGKGVKIQFNDGSEGIYGHMSSVSVKEGQYISDGQIIGLSGNTGHSTGPHLHFAMKENGEFIDPTPMVNETVNHPSLWNQFLERGSVANNDYPTIWGYLGEKLINGGIEHWISNYIVALPFLVGVSIGVWGLLNMVNSKIATWGVGFVMVLGGLVAI
ncbi:M23 family metallopeptidase [Metabacillus litoralis]|uniref:M23 family metallopeptidase n=1 Tax=Metabacillus litoralis TaxID=152268 RepID=UPI00203D6E78|nr:M23 family metallopeptidase [Metabacillus litoralis]MCM3160970.1 M23 family metallopeptidase [Metabacillus litoralis]